MVGRGPTRSIPHRWRSQAGAMSCKGSEGLLDFGPSFWQASHVLTTFSASFSADGQKKPCLKAFAARGLMPMWDPQMPEWISLRSSMPWATGIHLSQGLLPLTCIVHLAKSRSLLLFERAFSLLLRQKVRSVPEGTPLSTLSNLR